MREIYLLENTYACEQFIAERVSKGHDLNEFLGIGTYSTQMTPEKGLALTCMPEAFGKELADDFIKGYLTLFEQNYLFYQVNEPASKGILFSRWILAGQHLSYFSSGKLEIKNKLSFNEFMNVHTLEEFIRTYLDFLFAKVQEIRPETILLFFDIKMFHDYTKAFLIWLSEYTGYDNLKIKLLQMSELDLQNEIITEVILYFSDSFSHPCLGIIPSHYSAFEKFISTVRVLKTSGNCSEGITFRV